MNKTHLKTVIFTILKVWSHTTGKVYKKIDYVSQKNKKKIHVTKNFKKNSIRALVGHLGQTK